MKHGHRIPKDQRPIWARRALEIRHAAKSHAAAMIEVQVEFDVSDCTARNLISYGQFMADRASHDQVVRV